MAPQEETPSRDEAAAAWCMALADGELETNEQREFDAWLTEPGNADALSDAVRVWRAADLAADLPETIHIRTAALETFRRANRRRWTRRVEPRWYALGSLAAVLLLALLSFAVLGDTSANFQTGVGERRVAVLEDGSKVSLDAATELDVRLDDNRRTVVLRRGRAKFDVARDPLRPFSVIAGDKVVVATGTAFSVEMLGNKARVLLYEGHVSVLDRASDRPVPQTISSNVVRPAADRVLMPGSELVVALDAPGAAATVAPVDLGRSLSWEAGQLSFEDEPLALAVERMNRYSTTKLVVGDRAAAQARVSGVFDAGDLSAFVEGVTALTEVRASRSADTVTLRGERP